MDLKQSRVGKRGEKGFLRCVLFPNINTQWQHIINFYTGNFPSMSTLPLVCHNTNYLVYVRLLCAASKSQTIVLVKICYWRSKINHHLSYRGKSMIYSVPASPGVVSTVFSITLIFGHRFRGIGMSLHISSHSPFCPGIMEPSMNFGFPQAGRIFRFCRTTARFDKIQYRVCGTGNVIG